MLVVVVVVLVMSDVFLVTVNVFFVSSPLFPLSALLFLHLPPLPLLFSRAFIPLLGKMTLCW